MVGIVSLFYLAMLTNRIFLIHWEGPGKLENFLEPKEVNWTYNKHLLKELKLRRTYWGVGGPPAQYDDSRIEEYPMFSNWTENVNFNVVLDKDVESIGTIWYFAEKIWKNPSLYKRAKELGLPPDKPEFPFAMLGCGMDFLFKKSPYLEKELTRARGYLSGRPRPYIGIHIRTSDHHWGDNNPYSVRTKDPERVLKCAQRVETIIQAKKRVDKRAITWFLAADNSRIKDTWQKRLPLNVVTLKVSPMHLEHSADKTAFRDTLVDIFLLSECDYFIASWDSTFSYVALGLRKFSTKSFTYGERCQFNGTSLELAG
jgi:hypothetical protein